MFRLGKVGNSGSMRELVLRSACATGEPGFEESKSQKATGLASENTSSSFFATRGKASKRKVMVENFGTKTEK